MASVPTSRKTKSLLSPADCFALLGPKSPGVIVMDSFLGDIASESVKLHATSLIPHLTPAKMGNGLFSYRTSQYRGDSTTWISAPSDASNSSSSLAKGIGLLVEKLRCLRHELMGLMPTLHLVPRISIQLAQYVRNQLEIQLLI
jgi:hypothetical protein